MPPHSRSARRTRTLPSLLAAASAVLALAACGSGDPSGPESTGGAAPRAEVIADAATTKAAITTILDLQPGGATDVAFTTTGKKLRDFALDDDADPTLPNSRTFTKLKAGSYIVQAPTTVGVYSLVSINCTVGAEGSSVAINLPAGTVTIDLTRAGTVSCTFTYAIVTT